MVNDHMNKDKTKYENNALDKTRFKIAHIKIVGFLETRP